MDPSKDPLISLLNMGGKILEKLLINRINHYMYKKRLTEGQTIWVHATKEYYRRSHGGKKIYRNGTREKRLSHHDQPGCIRSLRRSMVAKHSRGLKRPRLP
jgi:hypothetical protein